MLNGMHVVGHGSRHDVGNPEDVVQTVLGRAQPAIQGSGGHLNCSANDGISGIYELFRATQGHLIRVHITGLGGHGFVGADCSDPSGRGSAGRRERLPFLLPDADELSLL